MSSTLEETLAGLVGESQLLVDRDVVASYESDWTGRFGASARCVVRPADTAETAAVVAACRTAGVAICVQGGNTGLVGGSVPVDGAVLLSTKRLSAVEEIDPIAAQVTVGAGATLASVQQAVRPAGFDVGVDFAARESCTIGGMVSTNAGGERVLRYGTMRAQVAGVEAVMPDGSVVTRLAGLPKDNTGYDLMSLLSGAEGTLGVLTRVRLRVHPLRSARAVALVAVGSTADAVDLVRAARGLPNLEAAELFYADGLAMVCAHTGLSMPFTTPYPVYVLLECAGSEDPTDELLAAIEASGEVVLDATVASDARGRSALWKYRESHTESINANGVPVKLDVAVPLAAFAEAVGELPPTIEAAAPNARTILFGHVNEGNLHVNILDALDHDDAVEEAVLKLVSRYGGSISAEHGVGRAKAAYLGLSRSDNEIAVMRAIKNSLDPDHLLNPGVLL
ncbi:MAG TPA: FAD-binding oxidoreductase [Mycobacteriales bacterium]|jgi:FAD/FMN-containing dehydrogenase|nr:FAD-binding oxidoreductase [Mycobacteriales bacterium]